MQNVYEAIDQLKEICPEKDERAQQNIKNLIKRLEHFSENPQGDKLANCIAEAEQWGYKPMRPAPMVTTKTDALIKELIGNYSVKTQEIIHFIADYEADLMANCEDVAEYRGKIIALLDLIEYTRQ